VSRRRLALAAAALGAAGAAAGLWLGLSGGSGGQSREGYLARVSAVCRTDARRLERVPAPSDPAAYGDVAAAVRGAVPLLEHQVAAMEALEPPAGLGPRLERLFALDRASIAALGRTLAAALRRDAGGVATGLVRFGRLRDRVHALAVSIGIDCAPS